MQKIGVFDSGVGGKSVATALQTAFPDIKVEFLDDREHMPYGERNPKELLQLVKPKLQLLEAQGCDLIVIACNSVTTTIINELREIFSLPIIGVEPMVSAAAEITSTSVIAVCATPTTLSSKRYAELKDTYAKDITVLEPDCSDWAFMIENDLIERQIIADTVHEMIHNGADVIVLGCTHYHWIEELIEQVAGEGITIIQPEVTVIKQVRQVFTTLNA